MKHLSVRLFVSVATFTAGVSGAQTRSGVLQEIWRDIAGGRVADLTDSPKYAKTADEAKILDRFACGSTGERCGSRYTALLVPPKTGEYIFWLASDDSGELWLAADLAKLERIAEVKGWTGKEEWGKQPGQKSQPVHLEAGKTYALQALHKEEGGIDHLSVAWERPGLPREVIDGKYLRLPKLSPPLLAKVEATRKVDEKRRALRRKAEAFWVAGKTLPAELTAQLPFSVERPLVSDTGINVLVDQAHQTSFAVLWGLRGRLRSQGFRACSSVASLNSVLAPGKLSRIRLRVDDMEPFAWWPNAELNVVITDQRDLRAQSYTPAERKALKQFVESGGGLLVCGTRPKDKDGADRWSMNALLKEFGARLSHEGEQREGTTYPVLETDNTWEVLVRGDRGRPIRARRSFGKGRVLAVEGVSALNAGRKDSKEVAQAKLKVLAESVSWLAQGKPPVGGDWRLPHMGGVGIFPDREQNLGGVVVYYAAHQKPDVLQCIEEHIPTAAKQLREWLPTKQFDEPYNIVICAGGGGGWAINARPKAAAVIAYNPLSILGIFAHEMAHTMGGPRNANDELAGRSPHHNQGEAHAGWFQGKIQAQHDEPARAKSNRNCNRILDLEKKKGAQLDFAKEFQTKEGREKWGKGAEWTKMWWVWQKFDDRYGPTWYPRWYWVRSTRWQDEPGHRETWEEMVEDMSIAVGEDLFPFFTAIGTTLARKRLERIEFQGQTIELPIAPLDTGPGGKVRLDPIGDYTKPLPRPAEEP